MATYKSVKKCTQEVKEKKSTEGDSRIRKEMILHDPTNYKELHGEIDGILHESLTKDRFEPFPKREKRSVFSADNMRYICKGKYRTLWRGMQIMKDPLDLIIYQQLLWHEKPRTIFEIGTFSGACAAWMADTMEIYGLPCHIYSLDIDHSLLHPKAKETKGVTFVKGDCNKIEKEFPIDMLKGLPHPWVVSEDAHINLFGCMEYFHNHMQLGDYFIIDDTSSDAPNMAGLGLIKQEYVKRGNDKIDILASFMEDYGEFYAVDSFYTDFFGYNGTFNWNGYIKRVV